MIVQIFPAIAVIFAAYAFVAMFETSATAGENIARGKSYTFSTPPNYALCTDEGDAADLTDGVHPKPDEGSALWGQKGCVGWNHVHEPISITVDLGGRHG